MTRILLALSACLTLAGVVTGLMVFLGAALVAYAIERTVPR
jgi:hypothetical protein